jgi:hypothetical protein
MRARQRGADHRELSLDHEWIVPDTLDQMLLDLPIMKETDQHVRIDLTPLRRLEDFATDLKRRLE